MAVDMRYIDERFYSLLPPLLQKICYPFKDQHEKAIVLLSSITALSSCFFTVKGVYDRDELYPNIYLVILAPPASKKSLAKLAAKLLEKIDRYRKIANRPSIEGKPALRLNQVVGIFLSANAGATFLIKKMIENEREGHIIFDTEADTLATILKQEWGTGVSEMLRKAFHHERISIGRSTEDFFYEINFPKLSLLLTGTPDQLKGLVKSFEDGLLSRCLVYSYVPEPKWHSVAPSQQTPVGAYFDALSETVFEIYRAYENNDFIFDFTEDDWKYFEGRLSQILDKKYSSYGDSVLPFVKRAGTIAFRIAMLFTIIRNYGTKPATEKLYAIREDIRTAIYLAEVGIENLIHLQESSKRSHPFSKLEEFVATLPKGEFRRYEAINIGQQFGNSPRTLDSWLQTAVTMGLLESVKAGVYRKK